MTTDATELSSLGSNAITAGEASGVQEYPQGPRDEQVPKDQDRPRSLSSRILSRTSTIASAVRDDNRFISEQPQHAYPSIDPEAALDESLYEQEQLEHSSMARSDRSKAVEATYDGEFNKQDVIDAPPDGGFWAWTCAFCVMLTNAFSWGGNSYFGVFLNYYLEHESFPGSNRFIYAFIGGLNLGLSFSLCALVNALVRRYHFKVIMSVGLVLMLISWLTAAEAKTITQLTMTQGLLLSIAYALVAGPVAVLIPTWFLKRRAFAMGIAFSGAGLAGIVFSRPIQAVMNRTGSYKWSLRMVGIVCSFVIVICIIMLRSYRKLTVETGKPLWADLLENFTRWHLYKNPAVLSIVAWYILNSVGYSILLMSLSNYSTSIGLTATQGSMVTTVQSIAQAVGRPFLGYASSRYGVANVTIIVSIVLGLICLVWWLFITTYGNLIAFALIAGILQGIGWVNYFPAMADITGFGPDLLAGVSMIYLFGGPPVMVCEIIGLELKRDTSDRPYFWCQIFVGIAILASVVAMLPFREFKIRRVLEARKKLIDRKPETDSADQDRLNRYNLLLKDGFNSWILRAIYPIKA